MPLNCLYPCLLSDYSGEKPKPKTKQNPKPMGYFSTFVSMIISQPPTMGSLYFFMSPEEKNDCKKN